MVNLCSVPKCGNESGCKENLRMHGFPLGNEPLVQEWIKAICRRNWYPTKNSKICGDHFVQDDYISSVSHRLRPHAVPSRLLPVVEKCVHEEDPEILILTQPETIARTPLQELQIVCDENEAMDVASCSHGFVKVDKVDEGTQTYAAKRSSLSPNEVLMKKKIKSLQKTVQRQTKKISNINNLLEELKKSNTACENLLEVLEGSFSHEMVELLKEEVSLNKQNLHGRRFSDNRKRFALTLHYYSPKAYDFMGQYMTLPTQRTLRNWLASHDCNPGFLGEVFEFLKEERKSKSFLTYVSLIIDGMHIREMSTYEKSSGTFSGNVDYGCFTTVNEAELANEAIMIIINSYSLNFKCPIAYFFVKGINADIQSQIISNAIKLLDDINIKVTSITCDGHRVNIKSIENLNCSLKTGESYFMHPDGHTKVNVFLDACHMLKLARNCIFDKIIMSPKGPISAEFIIRLQKLQDKLQLKFANKLTGAHIHYKNKIMSVSLAGQVLSEGVADAIDFLRDAGELEFNNSEATVEFLRIIGKVFDLLNCRFIFGKGFKSPINAGNIEIIKKCFSEAESYLKLLTIDGVPILNHGKQTFVVGFIVSMRSAINLAQFLMKENHLNYFLTYKCSQDHLELYFSAIRQRGGWNNNPSTLQFKWALRQMLFSGKINPSKSANVVNVEHFCPTIFHVRNEKRAISNKNNIVSDSDLETLEQYTKTISSVNLQDLHNNVIFYIGGYLIRYLNKNLSCEDCSKIINNYNRCSTQNNCIKNMASFVNHVNRGGLIYPSDAVFKVIHFTEKVFRTFIITKDIYKKQVREKITMLVVKYFLDKLNIFQPLHPLTSDLTEEVHEIQLIKKIVEIYVNIRGRSHAQRETLIVHGNSSSVRAKLNKLILFKHT